MRGARTLSVTLAMLLVAAGCQAPRATSSGTTPPPAVSASATASAAPDFTGKTLNVVTGGTGGVYILYGAALADLLTKKMKVAASAESTAASVANMQLIRDGKADLAFSLSDTTYDAVKGNGTFKDKPADAKALAVLYTNFTHIVVKDGAGINTIADLKGKRVSVGAANSGTEVIANRVLDVNGLDPAKDIQRERLGVADSASGLHDGKLDAFFWSGGLPTPQITDLANNTKLKLLDQGDTVTKLAAKYGPFYFAAKIPAGAYKDVGASVSAGVANILVVPTKMDPALARAILQTIFDNKADLEAVRPEAKDLTLASATVGSPIDFHPGAIDFYKSKGVWKP
ncbi:MAG TPA: TAXI family TRAP transporter solute-binding subunit [Candidatus Limnocylindria bacterium]|nr:TAXI family TRAP transporter solute-binding subunit [Candidatus Limnocylindria bacterium]